LFFPPINLPLEPTPWAKKVQAELEKEIARGDKQDRDIAALLAQNAAAARQSNAINIVANQAASEANAVGWPEGGYRGAVVAQDVDGIRRWTSPIGSIVPSYSIHLEDGASTYEVEPFGAYTTSAAAKTMLPEPLMELEGDTVWLDWPVSWGNEQGELGVSDVKSDSIPIQLSVFVTPHADGDEFGIVLPSGRYGAPWYVLTVYNTTAFTATVQFTSLHTTPKYAGTGVTVPDSRTFAPGVSMSWRVDESANWGTASVTPFYSDGSSGGSVVAIPIDDYYWANVASVQHQALLSSVQGSLSTFVDGRRFYHGRDTSVRIGKLRASVGTAPTGASILVDVKLNGTSILSSPAEITVGTHTVVVTPDVANFDSGFVGEAVVLLPSDFLTVEVTQVGSTVPGSDLTVQAYFG
jgi:hypothetical protein